MPSTKQTELDTLLQRISQHPLPILVLQLTDYTSFLHGPRFSNSFAVTVADLQKHAFVLPNRNVQYGLILPAEGIEAMLSFINTMKWYPQWAIVVGDEHAAEQLKLTGADETPIDTSVAPDFQSILDVAVNYKLVDDRHLQCPPIAFQPAPLLKTHLDLIEQTLLQRRSSRTPQSQIPTTLRCLDLGSGSGRDDLWLTATRPTPAATGNSILTTKLHSNDNGSNKPNEEAAYSWHVTAVDSDDAALERLQYYSKVLGVSDRIATVHATIADGDIAPKKQRSHDDNHCGKQHQPSAAPPAALPASRLNNQKPSAFLHDNGLQPFDMVLGVRFLARPLFPKLHQLLAPGGIVCWQTFCRSDKYTLNHPSNPAYILEAGELAATFSAERGWRVLIDEVIPLPDGRPVSSFIAQLVSKQP